MILPRTEVTVVIRKYLDYYILLGPNIILSDIDLLSLDPTLHTTAYRERRRAEYNAKVDREVNKTELK
jgi:hypothetical protein